MLLVRQCVFMSKEKQFLEYYGSNVVNFCLFPTLQHVQSLSIYKKAFDRNIIISDETKTIVVCGKELA